VVKWLRVRLKRGIPPEQLQARYSTSGLEYFSARGRCGTRPWKLLDEGCRKAVCGENRTYGLKWRRLETWPRWNCEPTLQSNEQDWKPSTYSRGASPRPYQYAVTAYVQALEEAEVRSSMAEVGAA
jgi:hypothetical protein